MLSFSQRFVNTSGEYKIQELNKSLEDFAANVTNLILI
jgi:hypothetical protein